MIRKILSICFVVIYLTITIGFPISIHHCHGQDEISIAISDESECNCSMNIHEQESCCSIEFADVPKCHTDHHQAGCCTHETKVIHFNLKQQLVQKQNNEIQIVEIDLFDAQVLFDIDIEEEINKLKADFFSDLPPKPIPLQVLNQEFIFYG